LREFCAIDAVIPMVVATVTASMPLLLAAQGELVVETAGVLNLGVEGMMLVGAVTGFAVAIATGSAALGVPAAALAGALLALLFGFLTQTLLANQVATGLALTLFGTGVSALIGHGYVGMPVTPLPHLELPLLSQLPVVGPLLFRYDALVYFGLVLTAALGWFLRYSRAGLILRAVGESHDAAHDLGLPVTAIRYAALAFGGALAGLGGAYLSLVETPMWANGLTAGRGWIALALVVFATWRPGRVLLGAWLFGGVTIAHLYAQGLGLPLPAPLLSMLPYLVTIAVLVAISHDATKIRLNAPACLGKPFHADR